MNEVLAVGRLLVRNSLKSGAVAVDATAGNGQDTLFLAELVGPAGRVYCLDIQEQAIKATRDLLSQHGLLNRVTLLREDHRNLVALVGEPVDLVMFNLGYLPGGDKSVVTSPQGTRAALEASLKILTPGGALSVVTYSGHPGGIEEEEAVALFFADLPPRDFSVMKICLTNRPNRPPCLWFVKSTTVI